MDNGAGRLARVRRGLPPVRLTHATSCHTPHNPRVRVCAAGLHEGGP